MSDRELFERAMAAAPAERAALLEAASADEVQRARIRALLAASDCVSTGFLEEPAARVLSAVGRVGRRLGAYRIEAEIGRGGMGTVYVAHRDDAEFDRRVAIKIVASPFGDDELLARFRRERQILAELEHSNICRLLDGGATEDGLPYLVMEFVEGVRIDQYCRDHDLSVTERVALFLRVCDAVQYAHSRLVVHRDLKPQNILVTAGGEPRLLDFGIATLVEADGAAPGTATLAAFTPEYASPEQIRGERITTASDVYSLGVILYDLLTGKRPHDAGTSRVDELFRVVGEEDPVRPSLAATHAGEPALASQLRGDLDAILLVALRKSPERRYPSVSLLSDDLGRYLSGLPVMAQGDGLGYRARSFVRRHRVGVAAAAALFATLLGGIVATRRQARVADEQRREAEAQRLRAEQRFADVRRLANSYLFEFHDAIATLPGSTVARKLVVSRALEYLDRLASEAGDDPELQEELADAYDRVGDVQGNPGVSNVGNPEAALASYRKAEAIRRALVATASDPLSARVGLATSQVRVGDALLARGAVQDAVTSYRAALALHEAAVAEGPPARPEAHRGVIEASSRLGTSLVAVGDVEGALANCERSLEFADAVLVSTPEDGRVRSVRAATTVAHGNALRVSGRHEEAAAVFARAIDQHLELLDTDVNNAELRRRLSVTYGYLAHVQLAQGRADDAARSFEEAVEQLSALHAADPANLRSVPELAYMLNRRAQLLIQLDRAGEARRDAARALDLLRATATRREAGGDALNEYAWALVSAEPPELRNPELALEYASRAVKVAGANPVYQHTLAWAQYRLGRREQARATLEQALAMLPAATAGPAVGLRKQLEADLERFAPPPEA